jgi:hypothetical protein
MPRPGGLGGEPAVLLGGLVPDLPRAVQLVAQAPQADAVGIGGAVPAAQVGQVGAAGVVGVLKQVAGLLHAAGAQVDGHHRLHAGGARPDHELVEPEGVRLDGLPGQVEPAGPVRADAVLPAVPRHEVAAGVPHQADPELPGQLQHVPAQPERVGAGMAGLDDAAVHTAAHVLDESAEHPAVQFGDDEVAVDDDA